MQYSEKTKEFHASLPLYGIIACTTLSSRLYVQIAEEEEPTEAQKEAFALLRIAQQRGAAAEILSKVLRNIVEHPAEAKYRSVRRQYAGCITSYDFMFSCTDACA